MKTINNLLEQVTSSASGYGSLDAWRDQLFQFCANQGYRYATLAIYPSHDTPVELGVAYLHTNLPAEFLRSYDEHKFGEIDPVAVHCMAKSAPLIWSAATFAGERQLQLYEEMQRVQMHAGVAMPYHGPCGEFGMLCFAGAQAPGAQSRETTFRNIAELSCFRDIAMDVFTGFMRKGNAARHQDIEITSRELECLKWCAAGKSSWDIAHLMNCTEATVNYHFANIRRKFGASSRRMAVIKAIQLGLLSV